MRDLIDRQKAIDTFEPWLSVKGYSEGELNMLKAVLYNLSVMPPADVRENVHGKWFYDRSCESVFECNICGLAWTLNYGTPEENNMNFCPKCGADMKGKR